MARSLPSRHESDDDGPPTPRLPSSLLPLYKSAQENSQLLQQASLIFGKRMSVLDIRASRRCLELSGELGRVAVEIYSWLESGVDEPRRKVTTDKMFVLLDEGLRYIDRVRRWL